MHTTNKAVAALALLGVFLISMILGPSVAFPPLAYAQGGGNSHLHQVAGFADALAYSKWQGTITGNPVASGTGVTLTISSGTASLEDGRSFVPYAAGDYIYITGESTTVPIAITSTSGCVAQGQVGSCTITLTTTVQHGSGDLITSGSYGVQEALNDTPRGVIELSGLWLSKVGGVAAANTIMNSYVPTITTQQYVIGNWGVQGGYWYAAPGLTNIAVPTALTTSGTATIATATTGGTIAGSSTSRFCVSYVDQFGGESGCSNDNASTATLATGSGSTNSYTVTAPVASTGAVGYRLYVSAASGAALSENLSPPGTANSCTQSTAVPADFPACAMGSNSVVSTLPATTAPGPIVSAANVTTTLAAFAKTTTVIRRGSMLPFMYPYSNVGVAGFWPVTRTSTTTNVAMADLSYPAGLFNSLGKCFRVVASGVATSTAVTVAGTWAFDIGPRNSSTTASVAADSIVHTASTGWANNAVNEWLWQADICTTATGATGTVEAHNDPFTVTSAGTSLNSNSTLLGTNTAASSAVDLTQQGDITLMYLQSANSWTVPQVRYMSITPLN